MFPGDAGRICVTCRPDFRDASRKMGGGVDVAKQAADHFTPDMLDPPKRGRPRKPDALTPAQRARAYRARKRDAPAVEVTQPEVNRTPWWPYSGQPKGS